MKIKKNIKIDLLEFGALLRLVHDSLDFFHVKHLKNRFKTKVNILKKENIPR